MTQTAQRAPQDMLISAFQLFEQGKFSQSLKLAEALRKDHPNHPDVLHLMGLLCLRGGDPDEAERFIRLAIAVLPGKAFFHVNLGNALRHQGRMEDARATYDKAVALDPQFPGSYANRGTLSAEEGREAAAIQDFETLISLAPQSPEGYGRLGQYYLGLGRFGDAKTTFERGLAQNADLPGLQAGLGDAAERAGDLDLAVRAAEKALELAPKLYPALRTWAVAKRRLGALEEARDRLERLDLGKMPLPLARAFHAELAQIYDRLNAPSDAYDHFKAQNDLAAQTLEHDSIDKAGYMAQVATLRDAFTPDWVASWTPVDASALTPLPVTPVFLVGFPRSGTTLLDQFLDAHDAVRVIEEKPILLAVRDGLKGGYPAGLADLDVDEVNRLRGLYAVALEKLGVGKGGAAGQVVVNKLPLNIIHVGLIQRVFPEAKIILSLRHPADAVLSCFMQDFQLNASMAHFLTLKDSAALYEAVMSLWLTYKDVLPLSVASVRYEELIDDPEAALADVMALLGLGWQPAQADHVAHAQARGTIRTPSYSQVTEPLYQRAADRWRRYETYLEGVLPRLAPFVTRLGYD